MGPQCFHPRPCLTLHPVQTCRHSAQGSPACPDGPGVGQTQYLLPQPTHQQITLAILSTTQASESCSEAGDIGLGEPNVIYPTLTAALHVLQYNYALRGGRSSFRRQGSHCQQNPFTPHKRRVSKLSASGRSPLGENSLLREQVIHCICST